jgi:hypothetical protein
MNALRAPLTALPVPQAESLSFLLDGADAFIDDPLPKIELIGTDIRRVAGNTSGDTSTRQDKWT